MEESEQNINSSSKFPDILQLWRDPPMEQQTSTGPDPVEIVTRQTLPNVLNDLLYTEFRTSDMTDLGNLLLGYHNNTDFMDDDSQMGRLSLAHENLSFIPKLVRDEFGPFVQILDISDNNIKNLDFLDNFPELTSLIADMNPINSLETNIPWLPKLELLYLNKCKILNLYWVETLRFNCPKLKYLSLMGNPVVPFLMTKENMYQYLQYRLFVISAIPSLVHLDDKKITEEERIQAKNMFPVAKMQNMYKTCKARFPHYLRTFTGQMNVYFSNRGMENSSETLKEKNFII